MNPGAAAPSWCGRCRAPRCGRVSAQRVLCHGKIIDSASECFRPEFFFFCLLRLCYRLGTVFTCVHGQGQKSSSFRSHNLPPSKSLSDTRCWSSVAHAVAPQGRVMLSEDFSELRGKRWGWFSPQAEKMAAREKLLNRRSISGKGREEACAAGTRLGLRLFGFPEAVGCGKHRGWQTWTEVRKRPGKRWAPAQEERWPPFCRKWSSPALGSHERGVLQLPAPAKLAPSSAGFAGPVPSFLHSGALAVSRLQPSATWPTELGALSLPPASPRGLRSPALACTPRQCCFHSCRNQNH